MRGASENSSVLSSVHAHHLISVGNLIWRMLTRTKDRLEENMENIAPSSTSLKKKRGEMDSSTLEAAFPALSN